MSARVLRLLASEGVLVALSEVAEGVRDVLRRRLNRLPTATGSVLRLAAVVGRNADVEVLVQAADADEPTVLDALEAGLIAGLLTEPAPGRVRFAHALVRDTIYTDLSRLRRARLHARVAAVLERLHPDELSALAHHYLRAASSSTSAKAVGYAVRAAEAAERRYAHDTAVELLTQATGPPAAGPPGHGLSPGTRPPAGPRRRRGRPSRRPGGPRLRRDLGRGRPPQPGGGGRLRAPRPREPPAAVDGLSNPRSAAACS